MPAHTITPTGPFSLAASTRFLEAFAPAAHDRGPDGHLHLAFPVEGDRWATAGVCARQPGPGPEVLVEVTGPADPGATLTQVTRILSIDVDGSGFPGLGRGDPVVAGLQARYPGLRPVTFWSPYEAAAWALISHRIRIMQASRIKAAMAARLGDTIEVHGETLHAFPGPERLAGLDDFPGLSGSKAEWLRATAGAAMKGGLDAGLLRSMDQADALKHLRQLPGIGRFSAELILLRGAGEPDGFPTAERRLARVMADAYGLGPDPAAAQLELVADGWRPYRTWVALLLRTRLEEDTGEIAGRGPG